MIFLPFKKTAWWLRWSTCIFGEICLASKKCLILTLSCNSIFVQDDLHIACEQAIKLIEGQSFVEAPEKVMAKVPKSLHVQISRSPQEASGVVNETFRLFSACESHSSQTHHLNYGKKKNSTLGVHLALSFLRLERPMSKQSAHLHSISFKKKCWKFYHLKYPFG